MGQGRVLYVFVCAGASISRQMGLKQLPRLRRIKETIFLRGLYGINKSNNVATSTATFGPGRGFFVFARVRG